MSSLFNPLKPHTPLAPHASHEPLAPHKLHPLFLGSDHAGWDMKEAIQTMLETEGYEVHDLGDETFDPNDDYPDFGYVVAKQVAEDPLARGILFCGNAQGICITANKVKGIRAGTGYNVYAVKTMRTDDDTNVLCLPGRVISTEEAKEMVHIWLKTPFSGEERHMRRLEKIKKIEDMGGLTKK
ncbi:MAG: Sugar-phosphate isomerase, RpiB/LacA/LacB family [Candidatus Uhrbacteria bacterium GW2011_GWF2_41_16]|uniref:Sugar-phosphate isomerase, RpiB/LacA/LacB family n=2 Tax=Candidatus Uhriibacteriota TaxID=1752732 RepID=A0A0G0YB86_9BACT|nr:MAG: Sugar-phosphate isomerase, RpiB/LacA/LacB family [Candidatus Uhrbacteria bacterium GW2011_GWC2_41_11]KKR97567.1 MAG: Sugar-phosphate isomerase, RpiB/LacA/LacB family [Candidatus Uhrbacteria bacterium GW2011_GWF2_41_16]